MQFLSLDHQRSKMSVKNESRSEYRFGEENRTARSRTADSTQLWSFFSFQGGSSQYFRQQVIGSQIPDRIIFVYGLRFSPYGARTYYVRIVLSCTTSPCIISNIKLIVKSVFPQSQFKYQKRSSLSFYNLEIDFSFTQVQNSINNFLQQLFLFWWLCKSFHAIALGYHCWDNWIWRKILFP